MYLMCASLTESCLPPKRGQEFSIRKNVGKGMRSYGTRHAQCSVRVTELSRSKQMYCFMMHKIVD